MFELYPRWVPLLGLSYHLFLFLTLRLLCSLVATISARVFRNNCLLFVFTLKTFLFLWKISSTVYFKTKL